MQTGLSNRSSAGSQCNETPANPGPVSPSPDQQEGQGTQDISLPSWKFENYPDKPGLGCRHYLYPHGGGFVYLVAIMDLWSRKILTWRTSISLESDFCVEALKEALKFYGTPEIFNTDQGSQFTCDDFIEIVKDHDIRISMDGKGRWIDNVFIERFRRTLKYDEVYLKAYETIRETRDGISSIIHFYNSKKTHSSLDCQTSDEVYFIKSLKDNVA